MRECLDEGILQSYFDGELSSTMAEGVASHIASCVGCAQAASELAGENLLLAEALGAEFALSVPTERLRQRVDAAIAALPLDPVRAGATSAASAPRRWLSSVAELFTLSPQRTFGYAGLAAVVLLASVIGGLYWNQRGSGNSNAVAVSNGNDSTVPVRIVDKPAAVPIATPTDAPIKPDSVAINKKPRAANATAAATSRIKLLPGERSYLKTIATLDATIKAENNRQMKASLQVEYQRNLAMVDQAIAATRSAAKVNPNDPDAAEFMFAAYQSKIDLLSQVADSRLSNRQH